MVTVAGLIFTVAGAIAALRGPDNRTGAQMLAVGLLWSLGALQLAERPFWFTLGYVLCGVAFVAFAHLILSYPTGRLRPGDEWLVWIVLALVTLGPLAVSLVDPTPIPGCDDCPQSAFLVTDRPGLAQAVDVAFALFAASVAAAVFCGSSTLPGGHAPATPRDRARLLFTLIALVGLVTATSWAPSMRCRLRDRVRGAWLAGPHADRFLAGILRTRLQRAGIADLVIALGNGRPLRDALADALGDPSLELAYWSAQRQAWVDDEGRTLTRADRPRRTRGDFVERAAARRGAAHDRSLSDQRGLVDAVAATASLAFEQERLQAELRAQYRFLETIIDTAPSLLSVVDTEGRIPNFNRAVEVASGLRDRARIEGRYFWEELHRPRRAGGDDPALPRGARRRSPRR